MQNPTWLTERPIAHRGFHDMNRARWENTPAAFAAAAERGYAIECDVHLSADGVPMVFHDKELKRLTGREGEVWQMTAAELSALRVGGTDERVPTLAEVLALVAGRVPLLIELKGNAGHDAALAQKAVACLSGYRGRAALMSFDHRLVRDLAAHANGLPFGLTAEGDTTEAIERHFSMLAHGIGFVSYAAEDLPNAFVTFVRKRLAMPVLTWTVTDEAGVEKTARYADQMTFEGFSPPVAAPIL